MQKVKLKYRYVKKRTYPRKFPNCPSYLLKKKSEERPLQAPQTQEKGFDLKDQEVNDYVNWRQTLQS